MGKQDNNGKTRETSMVLDLSDFVTEVDRFSRLIEPFALAFYLVDDLRRWRFFYSTIGLWLVGNVACLFLSQGVVFVLASSLVIAVATLALVQVHTQILHKILPNSRRQTKPPNSEDGPSQLETVENFRYSLIEMHDFVMKSNEYLAYFYSILKWDAVVPSVIYHIEACTFLLALVMFPARWNCFLFINWFFLCHPHVLKKCYRYLREYTSAQQTSTSEKIMTAGEKKEQSSSKEVEDADKDNCEDYDDKDENNSDYDMTDEVSDASMISLDPSPSKPGMVARLMEIKKRRKQIASESCEACNVSFASILKKRCYCRHCGYSFCNKCCYLQVPRSVFGATSPAAMKETVLVCCTCHSLLVSQGNVDGGSAVSLQQCP